MIERSREHEEYLESLGKLLAVSDRTLAMIVEEWRRRLEEMPKTLQSEAFGGVVVGSAVAGALALIAKAIHIDVHAEAAKASDLHTRQIYMALRKLPIYQLANKDDA